MTNEINRLTAEVARLRALLNEIVNYFEGGIMPLDLKDWRERTIRALAEAGHDLTKPYDPYWIERLLK